MIPSCIAGRILHVDLSSKKIWQESPSESFYRKYGGGSAMGMHYILENTPPGVDAFDPQNVLTIFVGVPTGLPISGQSRVSVNAKSPLTGAIGDSQAGGFFPAELKFAGFDGIVVYGRSQDPVYLWVKDGEAELRDAASMWGKITGDAEDLIKADLGGDKKIQVMQVGPAAEKGVRFASVINMCNRANGRTGMGTVMASKNLKAIAVRGSGKLKAADPKRLNALFKKGTQSIPGSAMEEIGLDGTARVLESQQVSGGLPTRNFNEGQFEGYETITGELMSDTILTARDTCFSCSVRCKRVVDTSFLNIKVEERYGGPEYETMAAFGSYCGVSDMDAVALANQICNQYGVDTISAGATIAFAMECFEKGILTLEDMDGIDLNFGNAEAMIQILKKIVQREGFGDVLAEGSVRAAQRIGKGAEDYLAVGKNQEAPAHMPQYKRALGVLYAVNPFGADHMSAEHDPAYELENTNEEDRQSLAEIGITDMQPAGELTPGKAQIVFRTQQSFSAMDSFSLCMFVWGISFPMYGPAEVVEMLQAATGWDIDIDEFLRVGERRINMMRVFNAREGFTRDDDMLSEKFFRPLQGEGPNVGVHMQKDHFESIKDEYYRAAGWDVKTGNPIPEGLGTLGLEWLIE